MPDWFSTLEFHWDEGNISKSSIKHSVECVEAESVFIAEDLTVLEDIKHSSEYEQRYHAIGTSSKTRLLTVTFTIRNHFIRIISSRPMNQREIKRYGYKKDKN